MTSILFFMKKFASFLDSSSHQIFVLQVRNLAVGTGITFSKKLNIFSYFF